MQSLNVTQHFEPLRRQLEAAAAEFSGDARNLDDIMLEILSDVERAFKEEMEIFPVCHHSPASALFMVKRLIQKRPKVIFMELCEDLLPLINELSECKLPVGLQAFASEIEQFPKSWSPLSVVAPITEFSAEYQAICYALNNEDCEIIFVDRSVDHVFQMMPQKEEELEKQTAHEDDKNATPDEKEERNMHGSALGVQMGELRPRFQEFEEFLLKNARVKHYSEWWDTYVEDAIAGQDYNTYRQVFYLIGSLFRRLGDKNTSSEKNEDCERERYMWQRMREYLEKHPDIKVDECLHICGAFHAVSEVEEYGINSTKEYSVSPRSKSRWLYGIIPSSYSAIEWQFSMPYGSISIASSTWQKNLKKTKLKPFKITGSKSKAAGLPKQTPAPDADSESILQFLTHAPEVKKIDEQQLLGWCVDIVRLARKNGYLASTADSIAIYQTSILLANMRNRAHPSPYDFQDAAITCLEKDMTPKKRNILRITEVLLGGDRIGVVGYHSLPPLAQDVYDRLEPLGVNLQSRTIQRALIDFKENPHLLTCSDLLWKLRYLMDDYAVRPIMGQRKLGHTPKQESWDIAIGKYQRSIIQLGYEGVTVEQVLEQRLKQVAYGKGATAGQALEAVEDSIIFLKSQRLTEEIGHQAVELLRRESTPDNAPQIFRLIRELIHYYRSCEGSLPRWLNDFVSTGYSHYCTMLPEAFGDKEVPAEQLSAMLGFILTLENLALSLGCSRSQFVIALKQSEPLQADKKSLLWTAEYMLSIRSLDDMRSYFDHVLNNSLLLPAFPDYIRGFVMALDFTSSIAAFCVELMSKAFERLPDSVLLPWMPKLIMALKKNNPQLMPKLLKEASTQFPWDINELPKWEPQWYKAKTEKPKIATESPGLDLNEQEKAVSALLRKQPQSVETLVIQLGVSGDWSDPTSQFQNTSQPHTIRLSPPEKTVAGLLTSQSSTFATLAEMLGTESTAIDPTLATSNSGNTPKILNDYPETMNILKEML